MGQVDSEPRALRNEIYLGYVDRVLLRSNCVPFLSMDLQVTASDLGKAEK